MRNLVLFGGQLEALATRQWTLLEASHHMRTAEAALPFTICSYTEPSRSATPQQLTIAKVSCLEAIAQSITMMYFISAPRHRKSVGHGHSRAPDGARVQMEMATTWAGPSTATTAMPSAGVISKTSPSRNLNLAQALHTSNH